MQRAERRREDVRVALPTPRAGGAPVVAVDGHPVDLARAREQLAQRSRVFGGDDRIPDPDDVARSGTVEAPAHVPPGGDILPWPVAVHAGGPRAPVAVHLRCEPDHDRPLVSGDLLRPAVDQRVVGAGDDPPQRVSRLVDAAPPRVPRLPGDERNGTARADGADPPAREVGHVRPVGERADDRRARPDLGFRRVQLLQLTARSLRTASDLAPGRRITRTVSAPRSLRRGSQRHGGERGAMARSIPVHRRAGRALERGEGGIRTLGRG